MNRHILNFTFWFSCLHNFAADFDPWGLSFHIRYLYLGTMGTNFFFYKKTIF
jgi:hypothetical protein